MQGSRLFEVNPTFVPLFEGLAGLAKHSCCRAPQLHIQLPQDTHLMAAPAKTSDVLPFLTEYVSQSHATVIWILPHAPVLIPELDVLRQN